MYTEHCGGAAEIACQRRHFYLGHDGGFMIPVHSKIGQAMRMYSEKRVNWYGRTQLHPVYIEDNICNFFFEQRSEIHRTNGANTSRQSGNEYGRTVRP